MKTLIGHHSYVQRAVVLVALAVLFFAAVFFWNHRVGATGPGQGAVIQVESHDVGSQMANCIKKGQYDDAVQIGLQALRNQPSDELILEEIATVYLVRAQKEPEQRENSGLQRLFRTLTEHCCSTRRTGMPRVFIFFTTRVAMRCLVISPHQTVALTMRKR
jgi:hypothetical protein